jgi:hypothetical protein
LGTSNNLLKLEETEIKAMKQKSVNKKQSTSRTVGEYQQYEEIGEDYSTKHQNVGLLVPSNFRMLCTILDVKIVTVLNDFMWMLSYSSIKNASWKKSDAARDFFLQCGYGKPQYTKKQINALFNELAAIRKIYDTTENMELDDMKLFWKCNHMYTEYWFKRWYDQNRRPDGLSALKEI